MKLLLALPGFHKYDRGAEIALLSVAEELACVGHDITVAGSGSPRSDPAYRFLHIPSVSRERFERFPKFPLLRNETAWEDLVFAYNLTRRVELRQYDATMTCSFPFTHWALRRGGRQAPLHFFVTQNGDWPAFSNKSEYRFFGCDGLICTNPDYNERNDARWNCSLIPNGADLDRFRAATRSREKFDLPENRSVVLMVSALIESKRVLEAIDAVSRLDDAFLVVAGDGPQRASVEAAADRLLPGRFRQMTLPAIEMPSLYASADVFLHMSKLESFGNVFVEAMASKLPIVGHDTDRLRWIVGDQEFLGDTSNLENVAELLKAAIDSKLRSENINVARFGWPIIGQQYSEFIDQTLHRRARSTTFEN